MSESRRLHIYEMWNRSYMDRVLSRNNRRQMDSAEALAETLKLVAPEGALELVQAHLSSETKMAAVLAQEALESGFLRYGSVLRADPGRAYGGGQALLNGSGRGDSGASGDSASTDISNTVGEINDIGTQINNVQVRNIGMNVKSSWLNANIYNGTSELNDANTHVHVNNDDVPSTNTSDTATQEQTSMQITSQPVSYTDTGKDSLEAPRSVTSQPTRFARHDEGATTEVYPINWNSQTGNCQDASEGAEVCPGNSTSSKWRKTTDHGKKPAIGEYCIPSVPTHPRTLRKLITPKEYDKTLAREPQGKSDLGIESIRQQKEAALRIARLEKQRECLDSVDMLFGESASDEDSKARRQQMIQRERQLKRRKEDMQIIEAMQRETREKLEAAHKRHAVEDAEERRAERRARLTENKGEIARKEVERAERRRKEAAEKIYQGQWLREVEILIETEKREGEAVLEKQRMDKLAADLQAAKERAASLKPCKKDTSKTNSASIPDCPTKTAEVRGNINGDDGLFVPENEAHRLAAEAQESQKNLNTYPSHRTASSTKRKHAYRPPKKPDVNTIRGRQGWRVARETDIIGRKAEELAVKMAEDKFKRIEAELEARARDREIKLFQEGVEREKRLVEENGGRIARLERLAVAQQKERAAEKKRSAQWEIEKHDKEVEEKLTIEVKKMVEKEVAAVEEVLKERNEHVRQCVSLLAKTQGSLFTSEVKIRPQTEMEGQKRKDWIRKYTKSKKDAIRRNKAKIILSLESEGEVRENRVNELLDAEMELWEANYRKKKSEKAGSSRGAINFVGSQSERQNHQDPVTSQPQSLGAPDGRRNHSHIGTGLSHQRARNSLNNEFAKAAATTSTCQLESSESEEDPDEDELPTAKGQQPDQNYMREESFSNTCQSPTQEPEFKIDRDFEETVEGKFENVGGPQTDENMQETELEFSIQKYSPMDEDVVAAYKVMHQTTRGNEQTTQVVLKTFLELGEANRYAQHAIRTVHWGPDEMLRGLDERLGRDNLYCGKISMGEEGDLIERVWVEREVTYTGSILDFENRLIDFSRPKTRRAFVTTVTTPGADGKPNFKLIGLAFIRKFANDRAAVTFLELVKPKTANIDLVRQYNSDTVPMVHAEVDRANEEDADIELEGGDVVVKVDSVMVPVDGPSN